MHNYIYIYIYVLHFSPSLAYVDAMMNEVTRMASFANFNVFHATAEDSYLNGYFIPKVNEPLLH